jgi:hypothetical protein
MSRPETLRLRAGLALASSCLHAPSTDSTFGRDDGPNWFAGHHHLGARTGLSADSHPLHLCCEKNDGRTPSGSVTFSVARRRVLVRPCGFPRARRQDASNSVSTTDVSRHEHPSKLPLWRQSPTAVGKPAGARFLGRARTMASLPPSTTPDHLAVIRPPAAARLTAHCRLQAFRHPHFMRGGMG